MNATQTKLFAGRGNLGRQPYPSEIVVRITTIAAGNHAGWKLVHFANGSTRECPRVYGGIGMIRGSLFGGRNDIWSDGRPGALAARAIREQRTADGLQLAAELFDAAADELNRVFNAPARCVFNLRKRADRCRRLLFAAATR